MSVSDVTYAIRVRELCSWTPSFTNDESECEEEDAKGNFEFDKEKNLEESDAESVADLFADLETGENMVNSHHVQEDVQEDVELSKDCNIKDSPVEHCENNLPSDSDPFELASLINKRCVKQVEEKSSETPNFPPSFALNSLGENQASRSFHQFLKDNSQQAGFSIIQRLEETIKVGIALGLNMEGCENTLTSLLVWGNTHFDFASTSARGMSGGILCLWNCLVFRKSRILCNENYMVIDGLWTPDDIQIKWIVVYALQNLSCK
ncbi:hypothetical protein Tco_0421413, partial [Tanacetum coccineum]